MIHSVEKMRRMGQDSEISRVTTLELPINYTRDDFYHAGPPTLVYAIAPNGIEYRVRLIDLNGITSNEVKKYPARFHIRVSGPLPRAPYNSTKSILSGELVRLPSKSGDAGSQDLDATESRELTGGREGSGTSTKIELGRGRISVSENGKIDLEVDGESILTADNRMITSARDITQYSFCGGMRRVLLRENMIANLVPTTLVTPLPMYIPDFSFLENAIEITSGAIDVVRSLR